MALSPIVQRALRESDGSAAAAPMGESSQGQPDWLSQLAQQLQQGIKVTPGSPVGGGGSPTAPAFSGGSIQSYVQQQAAARGWTGAQWDALYNLIQKESGWKPNVSNYAGSGAWGLFQFMPMHWKPGGYLPAGPKSTLEQQVAAGLRYIADNYGTPQGALNFWLSRKPINGRDVGNWY